jgi:hypothetical protein
MANPVEIFMNNTIATYKNISELADKAQAAAEESLTKPKATHESFNKTIENKTVSIELMEELKKLKDATRDKIKSIEEAQAAAQDMPGLNDIISNFMNIINDTNKDINICARSVYSDGDVDYLTGIKQKLYDLKFQLLDLTYVMNFVNECILSVSLSEKLNDTNFKLLRLMGKIHAIYELTDNETKKAQTAAEQSSTKPKATHQKYYVNDQNVYTNETIQNVQVSIELMETLENLQDLMWVFHHKKKSIEEAQDMPGLNDIISNFMNIIDSIKKYVYSAFDNGDKDDLNNVKNKLNEIKEKLSLLNVHITKTEEVIGIKKAEEEKQREEKQRIEEEQAILKLQPEEDKKREEVADTEANDRNKMLDLASVFIDTLNDNTKPIKNLIDKVSGSIVNDIDMYSQAEYLKNILDTLLSLTSNLNDMRTRMEPLLEELVYAVSKDTRYKDTVVNQTLIEFIVIIELYTKQLVNDVEETTNAVSSFNTVEYNERRELMMRIRILIEHINTAYEKIIESTTKAKTALNDPPRNGGRMMTRRKYKKSNRTYKKGLTRRSRTYKKGLTRRNKK